MQTTPSVAHHLALAIKATRKGKHRKAAKHLAAAASLPSAQATLRSLQTAQRHASDAAWPFPSRPQNIAGTPDRVQARYLLLRAQLQRIRAELTEAEEELAHLRRNILWQRFDAEDEDDDAFALLSKFAAFDEYEIDNGGDEPELSDFDDEEDEFAKFDDELEDTLDDVLDETEFGEFTEPEQVEVAKKTPRKSAKKPTSKPLKA